MRKDRRQLNGHGLPTCFDCRESRDIVGDVLDRHLHLLGTSLKELPPEHKVPISDELDRPFRLDEDFVLSHSGARGEVARRFFHELSSFFNSYGLAAAMRSQQVRYAAVSIVQILA